MIYKSGKCDCYESYDYVKLMIEKIGSIREFKVFKNDIDPYYEVENGYKKYYHFILFDNNDNEFWIDTNCGYPGTGPNYTEKILQILGLRDDYGVGERNIIDIKNPKVNNDLNILVVSNNKLDEYKKIIMLELKFDNAAYRMKVINTIKSLGNIYALNESDERFNSYFKSYTNIDKSIGEYRINNILFIKKEIGEFTQDDLEKLFKTMITHICGNHVIFTCNKIMEK